MSKTGKLLLCAVSLLLTTLAGAEKRVLFIGDSITDGGWGNSGGTDAPSDKRNHWDQNHIFGHSYMMLCASQLLSENPEKGYTFMNRGISGNDLARLEQRWQSDVIDEHPDILSVMIGTNDVHYIIEQGGNSLDYDDWGRRYRHLLDMALQANPDLEIVLCTTFTAQAGSVGQATSFADRQKLIDGINHTVRQIADQYDAVLVPFDSLMRVLPAQYPEQGVSYWCWDGIHPTPAGHRRMADLWIERTARLF